MLAAKLAFYPSEGIVGKLSFIYAFSYQNCFYVNCFSNKINLVYSVSLPISKNSDTLLHII